MTSKTRTDHFERAERMRRNPGKWVWIRDTFTRSDAVSVASSISAGISNYRAYTSGIYETKTRRSDKGVPQVWGRWMGTR